MSKLQELVRQWHQFSDAATQLQCAAEAVERALPENASLSASLHDIEIATSAILSAIDMRIAGSLPANPREAAILAAFACRAHNENDIIAISGATGRGERVFDEALTMALSNLLAYHLHASDGDLSAVLDMWCIPGSEAEPTRSRKPDAEDQCHVTL